MKIWQRLTAVLLTAVIMLLCIAVLAPQEAKAAYSTSTFKSYFVRVIGPMARAGYYKNNVLASLTASQAILESGHGTSDLAENAKNLFGIKGYSTWDGMIYDYRGKVLYSSYNDYLTIAGHTYVEEEGSPWRGYDSWSDSVADHNELMKTTRYKSVLGVTDLSEAATIIINAGYCSDMGYLESLVKLEKMYNLSQYNDITPNDSNVIAIELNNIYSTLSVGSTLTLSATIHSSDAVTKQISWASSDSAVASVSSSGEIKAKKSGISLISATIGDRDACCIIVVDDAAASDYNAKVSGVSAGSTLRVRESASESSDIIGKFSPNQYITVTGAAVIDAASNGWYPVSGTSTEGKQISGWSSVDYITMIDASSGEVAVSAIGFNKYEISIDVGVKYPLYVAVAPANAADKTLKWTTTSSNIASYSDGYIIAKKYGTATITATSASGVKKTIKVNVTSEPAVYSGVTTANLYVREEPDENSKAFGIIDKGITVSVIGEYQNGWYYVEGVGRNGNTLKGYSKADYIKIDEDTGIYDPIYTTNFILSPDSEYYFDGGFLCYVTAGTTVGELLAMVETKNVSVVTKEGNTVEEDKIVCTDYRLRESNGASVMNQAKIAVLGDVTGDGKVEAMDYFAVKKHVLGVETLDSVYYKAGCVVDGETLKAQDYFQMKIKVLVPNGDIESQQ